MNTKYFHKGPLFVLQKHQSSRLHYDLRLEEAGVLKSWAIPKGPSTDPAEKRLALQTPDHALSYAGFEGILEKGYGAGPVLLWDKGTFENTHYPESLSSCIEKGKLVFVLHGKKLQGAYALIRIRLHTPHAWLFFKIEDKYARPHYSITEAEPYSILSGKTIEELMK